MYAPHTITVYNPTQDAVTREMEYNITVLKGVFVDEAKGTKAQKSGAASADAVTVLIPFSVHADAKTFVSEKEYERLLKDERRVHWTLRAGKDFFIRGSVVEPEKTRQQLENRYDGVYSIDTVGTNDFGTPDMQHWQIGGR